MLTHSQVAEALAKAAGFDNRKPSQAAVEAWHEALNSRWPNLSATDLKESVTEHYATSSERMTVAHVYPAVRRIRERRAVEVSRQSSLAGPRPKKRSERGWSVMREPRFQQKRMEARVQQCEKFGLPHDGDGWTVADRPVDAGTTDGVLGKTEAAY